ncbi:uncharacterized protein [Miscanthus floridulus]|uniref:uncharacterized protein n=1 Tax=Miscanthus floridulus TaxID=154761 RepID=UPI00345A7827
MGSSTDGVGAGWSTGRRPGAGQGRKKGAAGAQGRPGQGGAAGGRAGRGTARPAQGAKAAGGAGRGQGRPRARRAGGRARGQRGQGGAGGRARGRPVNAASGSNAGARAASAAVAARAAGVARALGHRHLPGCRGSLPGACAGRFGALSAQRPWRRGSRPRGAGRAVRAGVPASGLTSQALVAVRSVEALGPAAALGRAVGVRTARAQGARARDGAERARAAVAAGRAGRAGVGAFAWQ